VRLHADDVHPGQLRKLTVEVAQAKNLPRMDLLGRCDTYCVLILNSSSKQSIYSTTVVPKNTNPEWNETFTWIISSKLDRVLTITVMDKDTLKSDDMVGCVYVNLHELPVDKEVNRWWPIENPARQRSLQECKLRLSISVRTIAQKPDDRGPTGVAAGRKKKGILPSRAPSSPQDKRAGGGVAGGGEGSALQVGWGSVEAAGDARASSRPAHNGFFPGSSGVGWGVGGGVPRGGDNRIAPAPTPQPASLPVGDGDASGSVDDLYQQLEDLTRAPVSDVKRPTQRPPNKMFKRAPSARGTGSGGGPG
jgi:hypothetical protein